MLVLPISMFVALLLAFLVLRMWYVDGYPNRGLGPLGWLVALCALQSLIISLAQYYGVAAARLAQPVTATLIPAVAWVTFVQTALRQGISGDWLHGVWAIVALGCLMLAPAGLDVLIPALFLAYGLAILLRCLPGPDALPRQRLENGQTPRVLWIVIAVSLCLSAMSDVLIVVGQVLGAEWVHGVTISVFSTLNLLIIGGLGFSRPLSHPPGDPRTVPMAMIQPGPRKPDPAEGEIMGRLDQMMADERPYLDPDLTLTRLARKIGVPAKTLSAAINRQTGQSVSRYINAARIAAAQKELRAGLRVTEAMLAAGFNTKSNFNREFLRVTGASPTVWLAQQDAQTPTG